MFFPLTLLGCSQTVSSDDLIYNPSDINQIGVGMVTGENMVTQNNINDKDIINQIVGILKGISVQELTEDQTREIFEDWSTKVKYDLTLISTEEISGADPRVGVKGFVTILNDGNMMFVEPKTIGPFEKGESPKTITYISTVKPKDKVNRINELIEKAIDTR